jgi:hypothetical protein
MPSESPNLSWLRSLKLDGHPEFGAKLFELLDGHRADLNMLEQQTNSNLNGSTAPPPVPTKLTVVPHPQGVQYSIQHDAEFYADPLYEIDVTANNTTHSMDVGTSRNGVLPVGALTATYQVRTRYANGSSSNPVQAAGAVTGGAGSKSLLASQGSSTTRPSQPPGFGGAYRGTKPPVRG